MTLVRHRLGGRALFGAAAVAGRPTPGRPARRASTSSGSPPRPRVAPGAPLRAHRPRPLVGAPPARLQRATSARGTASARPRALARARRRGDGRLARGRGRAARARGASQATVVSPGRRRPPRRAGPRSRHRPGPLPALRRRPRAAQGARRPRRRPRSAHAPAASTPSSSSSATALRPASDDAALRRSLLRGRAGRRGARPTSRASGCRRSRPPPTARPAVVSDLPVLRRDAGRRGAARRRSATRARSPTRCCASAATTPCARAWAPPRASAPPCYTWERAAGRAARRCSREAARVSFTIVTVLHDSAPELAAAAALDRATTCRPTPQLVVVDSGSSDDGPALARDRRRRGHRARRQPGLRRGQQRRRGVGRATT